MSFDDFSLAGEGEVTSFIPAPVQLAQMRDSIGGGKAHPGANCQQYQMKNEVQTDGLKISVNI